MSQSPRHVHALPYMSFKIVVATPRCFKEAKRVKLSITQGFPVNNRAAQIDDYQDGIICFVCATEIRVSVRVNP